MRTVLTVLAAVALAAALVFAFWSSRDEPAPPPPKPVAASGVHPAPFEAFAQARVGDWYAVHRINKQPPPGEIAVDVIFRVRAIEGERVTRAMRGRVVSTDEVKDEPEDTFPRAGLTLERLTGFDHAGWELGEVAITDDNREIAGRTFACKKVVFHPRDPVLPRKQVTTELWYSAEVPAGGLVAQHEVQDLDGMHFESSEELLGFGSAGGAVWGSAPAGL